MGLISKAVVGARSGVPLVVVSTVPGVTNRLSEHANRARHVYRPAQARQALDFEAPVICALYPRFSIGTNVRSAAPV